MDIPVQHILNVRSWVYDGFGRTVVERGVVAKVTMITMDKEYWSWVSI